MHSLIENIKKSKINSMLRLTHLTYGCHLESKAI